MERRPRQERDRNRFDQPSRGDRLDRFDRFDRSSRMERSDRTDRFSRSDRSGPFDRFERKGALEGASFSDRRPPRANERTRGGRFDRKDRGEDFSVRSGPRARAFDTRRFAQRSDFAKNAMVKIDSDIADFFGSPEAVNNALRALVQAYGVMRNPLARKEKASTEPTQDVAVVEQEEAATQAVSFDSLTDSPENHA